MNEKAFFNMSYGVYIATTADGDKLYGHIVNAVMQTSSSPASFCLCSNKNNLTCEIIQKTKKFAVSVLDETVDMKFIGQFGFKSGRDINKFENVNYKIGQTGCPIVLDNCVAFVECKVTNQVDVGSHILFIGEVVDADDIRKGVPLTYSNYHLVKKGLSPKNAPTYISSKQETKKEAKTMKKYVCQVCGYVYDPAVGDPDSGIAPGTAFEDIPDDWVCPVCGVGKDSFAEE